MLIIYQTMPWMFRLSQFNIQQKATLPCSVVSVRPADRPASLNYRGDGRRASLRPPRDKRRNLIKAGRRPSARHQRMCDARSHCCSRQLTTDVASQESAGPPMIGSSIFSRKAGWGWGVGGVASHRMRRGFRPLSLGGLEQGRCWMGEIKKCLKGRREEDGRPRRPFIALTVHHCHHRRHSSTSRSSSAQIIFIILNSS